MNRYVLAAEAEVDLDEIWEYIAADNVEAADRWIGKLFDAFELKPWDARRAWAISAKT